MKTNNFIKSIEEMGYVIENSKDYIFIKKDSVILAQIKIEEELNDDNQYLTKKEFLNTIIELGYGFNESKNEIEIIDKKGLDVLVIIDKHNIYGINTITENIKKLKKGKKLFDTVIRYVKTPPEKRQNLSKKDREYLRFVINESLPYIARNKDGLLYAFDDKPIKQATHWGSDGKSRLITDKKDVFRFIQWEDKNPSNIQELLENID